jgi:acyl-CoA synthetase (AMP-forming)/AMP-acid ligase II
VYPAEVERVLSDHPDVRAAAVIGVPDDKWGEAGRAYLELKSPGQAVDANAMGAWAKERLASYKVPKSFVVVEELPRNASGKVQKHRLGEGAA